MSKAVEVEVDGGVQALAGVVRGGCLECGANVPYERTAPEGTEVPIHCPACGFELALRRLGPDLAAVRRPYGCRRFVHVDSSHLESVGVRRRYLVIRFRSGGVYRYIRASELFDRFLTARSPGRTFHREVRGKFEYERLCARYGCFRPSADAPQVLCRECLYPHRK